LQSLKHERVGYELCDCCDDMAFVIAETMPGLCHIDVDGHKLINVGLLTILDKCRFLKSLYVHECYYLDLSEN
jgi:hypothetical protein